MKRYAEVSVDEIRPPAVDMRSYLVLEGLEELAGSIKRVGVLVPLDVRPRDGGYEIVDGHRRFEAAKMAGLAVVPCVVSDRDDEETERARLHANLFREDVNPVDEARYLGALVSKYSYSMEELCRACGKMEGYVQGRLDLLQMDVEMQAALEAGKVGVSVARELARVDDGAERSRLLYYAIEAGCTSVQARRWRWDWEIAQGRRAPVEAAVSESGHYQEDVRFVSVCPVCRGQVDSQSMLTIRFCPGCYGELTTQFLRRGGEGREREGRVERGADEGEREASGV